MAVETAVGELVAGAGVHAAPGRESPRTGQSGRCQGEAGHGKRGQNGNTGAKGHIPSFLSLLRRIAVPNFQAVGAVLANKAI